MLRYDANKTRGSIAMYLPLLPLPYPHRVLFIYPIGTLPQKLTFELTNHSLDPIFLFPPVRINNTDATFILFTFAFNDSTECVFFVPTNGVEPRVPDGTRDTET